MQEEANEAHASMFGRDNSSCSPSDKLRRGFKKASLQSRKHGNARTLLMNMVKKAEKRILELKRASGQKHNKEAKAEGLAKELFHKPGTLLTQEEFGRMYQASGCHDAIQTATGCNQAVASTFRKMDGTCNNRDQPTFGAASTQFRRLINPWYEDGCDIPLGRFQHELADINSDSILSPANPSARLVSMEVIKDADIEGAPFTHMMMQWGQFLDHDMDLAPEHESTCASCDITDTCEPIRIPDGDSVFFMKGSTTDGKCLSFRRSIAVCGTGSIEHGVSPREQINDLTSFIDGSMVYGSSDSVAELLYEVDANGQKTGFMKTSNNKAELPLSNRSINPHVICITTPCYDAGDVRVNEQVGLTSMHTLFVLYHNVIAKELMMINPHWNGERVFQETRKIVGAMIQKITYEDYLPKVLGQKWYDMLIGQYVAYNDSIDAGVPNSFATAAYRYGHSLIQATFDAYSDDTYTNPAHIDLIQSFFSKQTYTDHGLEAILRGLITQNSMAVDENVNSQLTEQLFLDAVLNRGMDLVSLNIQRQRDHGMPKFGVWQQYCTNAFPELPWPAKIKHELTLARLLRTYGFVENADLWVGGMAEELIGDGGLVGPTFACIFADTFKKIRDGDRFWYENPEIRNNNFGPVFTPEQLTTIKEATLSSVICSSTSIAKLQEDVFLNPTVSGNERVSCNSIPELNLDAWKEDPCYVAVDVEDAPEGSSVILVYKNPHDQQYAVTKQVGPDTDRVCAAISCPPYRKFRIRITGGGAVGLCEAKANSDLPDDQSNENNEHVYAAFGGSMGSSNYDGIYTNEQKCLDKDEDFAIEFECDDSQAAVSVAAGHASTQNIDCTSVANQPECEEDDDVQLVTKEAKNMAADTNNRRVLTAYEEEMKLLEELTKELES